MPNPIRLNPQPSFESNNQVSILNVDGWIRVNIPDVFTYTNNNWAKVTLYHRNSKFYTINWIEYWLEENNHSLVQKTEIVTRIDLFNFRWLSDEEIVDLINKSLCIDINTPEWISKLNSFFSESIDFLGKLWKTVPNKVKQKIDFFSSKEEVVTFCKSTYEWKKVWYLNCIIAKSVSVVADIINNEWNQHLEERARYFEDKYIKWRHEIRMIPWIKNKWYLQLWGKEISFSYSIRNKSDDSFRLKVAKDPKYFSSSEIFDSIWIRFYTYTKIDAILLNNYFNCIIAWESGDYKINNKNFYTDSLIDSIASQLNPTFVNKLKSAEDEVKIWSSDNYSECKTKVMVNIPRVANMEIEWIQWDDIWVEIQYDTYDSINEKWLSFQPIYWYFKYFDVLCRLYQWYISEHEIDYVIFLLFSNIWKEIENKNKLLPDKFKKTINEYYKELEEDLVIKWFLNKWNANRSAKIDELKQWVKDYYLSKLLKVNIEWRNSKFYTNPREYNLSLAWYRKKMTIIG